MPYPFLSDEWVDEAHRLRLEYEGRIPAIPHAVRMNLVVTEVPFGDGDIDAHVDTTGGQLFVDRGHIDDPDLTVTVPYATARAILVEGDAQAAMQAFMMGQVRIEGDMAKLIALQGTAPDPAALEMAGRLRAMTE
ncbi:MAG TPA: SCP2 sterol-binding domain-containing protein [Acidimicrobiales bacterium]|nr:SCP2 sterol-binding domain-containing protein [Acidimicrobiales bacterium]